MIPLVFMLLGVGLCICTIHWRHNERVAEYLLLAAVACVVAGVAADYWGAP